ncbi:MAG: hypothetical protein NTV87_00480 [Ignavibacteriae bacterium]|nr:hypothetical protein [Ignavibacteriota bacterium]
MIKIKIIFLVTAVLLLAGCEKDGLIEKAMSLFNDDPVTEKEKEKPIPRPVQRLDFEAGGFVLYQMPAKDGRTLYARTDVGGVYKKQGSGDWKFISEFAITPACLMVQGIDINPFNQSELIIACGTDYLKDDIGRGLWKSADEGATWTQVLGPNTGNGELNYGGNVLRIKIGGPCIKWHPSVQGRIYTGGLANEQTGRPNIYASNQNGEQGTWDIISTESTITGNVVCIQIHADFPDEIWVGTDKGLWRTTDNGNTWSEQLFPGQIDGTYQILLKKDNKGGLKAFISTGNLYRIENNASSIRDLTQRYGKGSGYGNMIIGLVFSNYGENKLVAKEMGILAKSTTDDGETWSKPLKYNLEKEHNPKHTLATQDKIYTSNVLGSQNPVNPDIWYMSGGAGPFLSTNNGETWRFHGNGIDMVVVYDVSFSMTGDIYVPISDWGMARTNDDSFPKIINYSRQSTLSPPPPEKNGDSYMPNVCRVLISQNNPERIYLIGGSVFTYYPVICKSEKRGEPNSYHIMNPSGIISYPRSGTGHDAIISDGDITSDGINDHLIVLMGGGQFKRKIYDAQNPSAYWYGVYHSSDNGESFAKSEFPGESENIYKHSIVGGLFSPTDYIESDPANPSKVYLYLEGGNDDGVMAGGLFISTDYGRTFTFRNYVVDNPAANYRSRGAINIDHGGTGVLWAGIDNYGLSKSDNSGASFTKLSGWESALTVDAKGNVVAAFGRRTGDAYNKIYLSKDGGETWEHIYFEGHGVIPSVRKINIRENKDGELWISTSGQGLFIYRFD